MSFSPDKSHQDATEAISSPRIVTSAWSVALDPTKYCRVGISRGTPRRQAGYRRYPALAPGSWFRELSAHEFRRRYCNEVLNPLDPKRVIADLEEMADGRILALLCFEPPNIGSEWCHRGFVSEWLYERLGLEVFELGQEHCGCGPRHPKLPAPSKSCKQMDLF